MPKKATTNVIQFPAQRTAGLPPLDAEWEYLDLNELLTGGKEGFWLAKDPSGDSFEVRDWHGRTVWTIERAA